MGGSASAPRTVTVESPLNEIRVSEAVLRRISSTEINATSTSPPTDAASTPPATSPQEIYRLPPVDYSKEEEYWTKRIENLKRSHRSIKQKMEDEYDKALLETAQIFKSAQLSSVGRVAPCQNEKNLVLQCYKENSTKTLMCTELVNLFNDCVLNTRLEHSATRA